MVIRINYDNECKVLDWVPGLQFRLLSTKFSESNDEANSSVEKAVCWALLEMAYMHHLS